MNLRLTTDQPMIMHTVDKLIPINQDSGEPSVNARDLHVFLENGDNFSVWIKDRIRQFDFTEGVDYQCFKENAEKQLGGRPSWEYCLSMDMAKELAMVERSERGRQARKYFISCEKALKEVSPQPRRAPQTFSEALRLAADMADQIQEHRSQIEASAPKVEFHDRCNNSNRL